MGRHGTTLTRGGATWGAGPSRGREETDGSPRRPLVLMVEDEAHDWEIYGKLLWYNGFEVIHATDGEEGLRVAEVRHPDLLLLDVGLPKMDGLELCRRLSRSEETRDIPVVVLTARPERELGEAAREAGCLRYIEKPAGPLDVLHAVEEIVGRPPPAGVD